MEIVNCNAIIFSDIAYLYKELPIAENVFTLIMNFNFLFGIVGDLNFIVTFLVNGQAKQDFFIFDGNNATAHLHRYNQTIYLQLDNGVKTTIYKTDIENMLEFSWSGFKVNGTEMVKVGSNGNFSTIFNAFTFLSPLTNFSCLHISNEDKSLGFINSTNTNYGYIVGIILIITIVFDIKPKTWQLLKKVFNNLNVSYNDDSTYETMNKLGAETEI